MIPLGSDSEPRLVIGHNVAYDRIRVGDEYRLEVSGTRYLDTMALHIAVAGMTSQQVTTRPDCRLEAHSPIVLYRDWSGTPARISVKRSSNTNQGPDFKYLSHSLI